MSAVLDKLWYIRPMTASDLPEVLDIERVSYDFPWNQGIFEDCLSMGYRALVVNEGATAIRGYGLMSVAVGEAHLLNLCVAPLCRRTGMARYLLGQLIESARRDDAYVMFLEVRPSNRAALALYHQAGFATLGRRRAYYPAINGREDAVILSLDIE